MPGEGPESRACGFSHRLWGRGYTCAAAKGRPRAIDIAHLGFRFEDRIPERRKTGTEGTPVGSPRNRCRAAVLYRGTEGHRYSSPRFIGLSTGFEDRTAPQRRKAAHLAKGTPVGSPRESCCDGFSSTEFCDLSFVVFAGYRTVPIFRIRMCCPHSDRLGPLSGTPSASAGAEL